MSRLLAKAATVIGATATAGAIGAAALVSVRPGPALQAVPSPVVLTYGIAGNEAFAADVRAASLGTQRAMAGRLCLPLVVEEAPRLIPAACASVAGDERAIVAVIVLRDGSLWRFFLSHPAAFEQPVPLGSIAKAVVGLPLLAHADASADETWCDAAFAGFRNSDGSTGYADCTAAAAGVPALQVFGRSGNLPLIWRLRRIPESDLRRQLAEAGVANIGADYSPAVAVALGVAELSMRQVLECVDALASGSATRASIVEAPVAPPSRMAVWCASAIATPARRSFVHAMLAAPGRRGGTAAYATALLPGANGLLVKTGTPTNESGLNIGKALLGSFHAGGSRYSFLVALLAPRPALPLGDRLAGVHLAPLVGVVAAHTGTGPDSHRSSQQHRRASP